MDQTLQEMLGRLADLSAEEVQDLHDRLLAEFDRLDSEVGEDGARNPQTVALMNEYAEACEAVRTEQQQRAAAQDQANAQADDLRRRLHGEPAGDQAGEGEGEGDQGQAQGDDGAQAQGDQAGAEGDRVPVAASGQRAPQGRQPAQPSLGDLARQQGRQQPTTPTTIRGRATITASSPFGGEAGVSSGQEITDDRTMGRMFYEAVRSLRGGRQGRVMVASVNTEQSYPAERDLRNVGIEEAGRRMDAVTAVEALTASGGICAPVEISYDLMMIAAADRPLKAGLPSFLASRGGLQFVMPADISTYAGATSVWTEALDANPGGATKALATIACGSVQQALVDAIPTRLKIGNMEAQYNPEQVQNATQTALAAAARIAELNLLGKISAACTQVDQTTQYVGASSDLLAAADLAVAAFRYRHRTAEAQTFTAILPTWLKPMMRADVARQIAHTTGGSVDPMALDDATITSWLRARGLNVIWILDGLAAQAASAPKIAIPFQGFGAQAANAVLAPWPSLVRWQLFPEGSFQFLDGGRLDLGIVRDSTLDGTNDYETFAEPFEGVAYRGVEALEIVSNLVPNGATAGTVAPSSYTAGI